MQIILQIPDNEHAAFKQLCWEKHSNMSKDLRDYIQNQIKLYEQNKVSTAK